jgi:hypothetical protein
VYEEVEDVIFVKEVEVSVALIATPAEVDGA